MNTTNKHLKAPFGWVGGKSKLAKDIVAAMPVIGYMLKSLEAH